MKIEKFKQTFKQLFIEKFITIKEYKLLLKVIKGKKLTINEEEQYLLVIKREFENKHLDEDVLSEILDYITDIEDTQQYNEICPKPLTEPIYPHTQRNPIISAPNTPGDFPPFNQPIVMYGVPYTTSVTISGGDKNTPYPINS